MENQSTMITSIISSSITIIMFSIITIIIITITIIRFRCIVLWSETPEPWTLPYPHEPWTHGKPETAEPAKQSTTLEQNSFEVWGSGPDLWIGSWGPVIAH